MHTICCAAREYWRASP